MRRSIAWIAMGVGVCLAGVAGWQGGGDRAGATAAATPCAPDPGFCVAAVPAAVDPGFAVAAPPWPGDPGFTGNGGAGDDAETRPAVSGTALPPETSPPGAVPNS